MNHEIQRRRIHELRDLLLGADIPPDAVERILAVARWTVELRTEPASDDDFEPGQSRIGGRPDLPNGSSWPEHGGSPMFFLAQLNLSELPSIPGEAELPAAGVLSFFFTSSFDHVHEPDAGRVLFFEDAAELTHRVPAPERDYGNFAPCRVVARPKLTLPTWSSPFAELLALGSDDNDALSNLLYDAPEFLAAGRTGHRLLGHPDNGQSDAAYTAAQEALKDAADRSEAATMEAARRWHLLFQCIEDEDAGMSWVDSGSVCFVLRHEDMAARRFDRVFTDLQFD